MVIVFTTASNRFITKGRGDPKVGLGWRIFGLGRRLKLAELEVFIRSEIIREKMSIIELKNKSQTLITKNSLMLLHDRTT